MERSANGVKSQSPQVEQYRRAALTSTYAQRLDDAVGAGCHLTLRISQGIGGLQREPDETELLSYYAARRAPVAAFPNSSAYNY